MAIADYPEESNGGPYISRLITQPVQYSVGKFEYEDGGADYNVQPCGLRAWVLEYEGLTESEVTTLRAHFDSAQGQVGEFSFYHRRDATTYTSVKYQAFKVGKHRKKWSVPVTVTLVQFQ